MSASWYRTASVSGSLACVHLAAVVAWSHPGRSSRRNQHGLDCPRYCCWPWLAHHQVPSPDGVSRVQHGTADCAFPYCCRPCPPRIRCSLVRIGRSWRRPTWPGLSHSQHRPLSVAVTASNYRPQAPSPVAVAVSPTCLAASHAVLLLPPSANMPSSSVTLSGR